MVEKTGASLFEEGLVIGLVGACLVAGWFFVLDAVAGQPFFTPTLLGAVIFDGAEVTAVADVSVKTVFAYTGLHVLLFLLVGWGLALMFREMNAQPHFGIVYLLVFVLFEAIVFGIEVAMLPHVLGVLGSWAVGVGNAVSALGMFWALLRRYPSTMPRLVETWQANERRDSM